MVEGNQDEGRSRQGMCVPITPTADSEPVWQGLRETWLALRSLSESDASFGGAFKWNANSYRPVVVYNEQGRPLLAFSHEEELGGPPATPT